MFVHGLGGDAFATWRHGKDDSTSWPHWIGHQFPDVGVWSLGYAASATKWTRALAFLSAHQRDAGYGMALPDRALQVLDLMVQQGLGQRPLLFICHSLGGLVAKQILRTSSDADDARLKTVFANTRAVLFLATPHAGTDLASLADSFRTVFGATVTIEGLRAHDAHLRELFNWYRNHAAAGGIQTATYYELRGVNGVSIVNPTSAHPGVGADPVGLDEDHISIAKPLESGAQVCGAARDLLRNFVLAPRPAPASLPVPTLVPPSPAITVNIEGVKPGRTGSVLMPHELPPAAEEFSGPRPEFEPDGMFDVFLSHAHTEAEAVESIAVRLEDTFGLRVWLDRWILVPGEHWQQEMARGLDQARTCAVCVGSNTPSGWFREEIERALHRQTKDKAFRVIPVILPTGDRGLIDGFLELRTWVEFRKGLEDADAFHMLVSGVRGLPPGRRLRDRPDRNDGLATLKAKLSSIRDLRSERLIDEEIALEYQRRLLDELVKSEK